MAKKGGYHLSVGVFFNLLLVARKHPVLRQEECLRELLCIYDKGAKGLMGNTLKSVSSRVRNCDPELNNEFLRFGEPMVVDALNERLKASYDSVVGEMKKFLDEHIDIATYGEWLIRALLELISSDPDIKEPEKMVVIPGNIPVYPEDLPEMEKIFFYNFILGVWLYLCCAGKPENGLETYHSLSEPGAENRPRNFKTDRIGKKKCAPITMESELDDEDFGSSGILGRYCKMLGLAPAKKKAGQLFPQKEVPAIMEAPQSSFVVQIEKHDEYAEQKRLNVYWTYLNHAEDKHKVKRTFLYENQRPFYDFFVCNDVKLRTALTGSGVVGSHLPPQDSIKNATVDSLSTNQRFLILSGTGGLGKSMMMNHLMLDAIKKNGVDGRVPIFAELRGYDPGDGEIIDYIFREFRRHDPSLHLPNLIELLTTGKAVILLDGLDEIKGENLERFYKEVDMLVDNYPDSMYIISSRPNMNFRAFSRFVIYDLQPFDQGQAISMIEKLDNSVVAPEIQKDFITDLKNNRFRLNYKEKEEFLGNPLFLTIMLLSYEENHDIPTQRYEFYEQAYDAMARRHDATKGLTREFSTGLDGKSFQLYFGEFCAITYEQEKYDFTPGEIEDYFWEVIKANRLLTTPKNFIEDITGKICLMFMDGGKYRFVHRSFQEYFAAYFFSEQLEQNFDAILEMFIERDDGDRDGKVLPMLYGMKQQKTELCIFIPFLRNVFDTGEDNEYGKFLERFYSVIEYEQGDTDFYFEGNSDSTLYDFIAETYDLKVPVAGDELPEFECFADEEYIAIYTLVNKEKNQYSRDLVCLSDKDEGYDERYYAEYGEYPEVVGRRYRFRVKDLYDKDYYSDVLAMIMDDSFPLKKEYLAMKEKYFELKQAYEKKKEKKSFISRFHP